MKKLEPGMKVKIRSGEEYTIRRLAGDEHEYLSFEAEEDATICLFQDKPGRCDGQYQRDILHVEQYGCDGYYWMSIEEYNNLDQEKEAPMPTEEKKVSLEEVAAWLLSDETFSEADEYTSNGFGKLRAIWFRACSSLDYVVKLGYSDFENIRSLPPAHKHALYKKFSLKPKQPEVKPGQHWRGDDGATYLVTQESLHPSCGKYNLVSMRNGMTWIGSVQMYGHFTLIKDV